MQKYISLVILSLMWSIHLGAQMISSECPELTGRIIHKDHPGYDEARLVSNYYTSKDKYPLVIVYCQNAQDVQHAIQWARCKKMDIRIRSGGHNHEGFSTGNDVLVIDVSEMKNIKIDKQQRTVTIDPGVNNKELYIALFKEGFTHAGGTCSEVSLSGLVLTGGMGPLFRREGLTCDTLLALEMIDAEGRLIHATKENEHKDLFWASCGGGGGNFGVVTSLTLKIFDATPVTWFNIGWNWDQPIDSVILAWQDFFSKPDQNWFSHLDLWSKNFPSDKLEKSPIKILGMFWGTPEEARRQLAPLLKIGKPAHEVIKEVNWEEAIRLIEESTAVFLTEQPEYKSTGAFVRQSLPPEGIKIMTKALKETTSPLFNVLLFSLGVQKIRPTDTAYFYRDAKFFINYSNQWLEKMEDRQGIEQLDNLRQQLLPFTQGDYVGNPDSHIKDYLTVYYGSNLKKLQCIKKKYDPDNVFHFEQSIPPGVCED